jgi:DNA-binding beta-propeller fold protein YncE
VKLIASLLVIGCIVSLAPGQWLETTLVLPDPLSGFGSPGTMLYNTGNNFLFVGCENGVAIIDGFTNKLLAHVNTRSLGGPACYASQINKLYWLGGSNGGTTYVLDGATGRDLKHITTPNGSSICYNPVVNRVYVSCYDTSFGYLIVIDAAQDSVVSRLNLEAGPQSSVCCDPADNKVYVMTYFTGTVTVVDCDMDSIIGTIPFGFAPGQLVHNRVSNKLYCCSWGASVTIIDCRSDTVLGSIVLPGGVEVAAFNPVANKLYCDDGEGIDIICGQGDTLLGRLPRRYVRTMVCDSTDDLMWCGLNSDTVVAIDGQGDSLCAAVAVGNTPEAMCYNPTRNRLYLEDGHLTVFNPAARQVDERILLGFEPVALCWARSSHKIYCAGRSEAAVEVLTIANQVLDPVPVGRDPVALAYDRPLGIVCCANNRDSTVSIIACNGDSVIGTVRVGPRPGRLCVDTILHKAWCSITGGVAVVDLQAESLTAVIPVADTGMLLADMARARVYCATGPDAHVEVLDAEGDSTITSIAVGGPAQALSLNPGANLVYCATHDNDAVAVIDGAALRVVNIIPVGMDPAALFYNERHNKLYCANGYYNNDETVTVVDCGTETPVATIDLKVSPSALAYDSVGDRLYCLSTRDSYVAVVDCQRDTMVKLIRVGLRPVAAACAFNFRRTYVANRYGSSLSVIRDSATAWVDAPDGLPAMARPAPTIIRGTLYLPRDMTETSDVSDRVPRPVLLDISGRKVMDLKPGPNDVRALAPGVYFVRTAQAQAQAQAVRKVLISR